MAKNKNAKVAKKEEKTTPVVKNDETKKSTENVQVAAETVTEEKKAPEVKKETKKEPKPKKEKTPTLVPEVVEEDTKKIPSNIPIGATSSSFDAKAQYAFVLNSRYGAGSEGAKETPELAKSFMKALDIVLVLGLVDLRNEMNARNANGEFNLIGSPEQMLQLESIAATVGIKLPAAKALPGNSDGQMQIDFNKAEVPAELEEKPEERKEVELDPTKVTTVEALKETLNHLLKNGKNVAENVVNTVEWYRVYRIGNEENADKKLALDDRTVKEWLDEIFSIVEPTAIFNGLGGAIYLYASQTNSPVKGHCILHKHISKTGWSEEQIADLVKAFVEGKYRLKVQNKEISDKPEENKALNTIIGKLGLSYIDKVFADANTTDDESADARAAAKKTLGLIRTNYFPSDKAPSTDELRMKLGQIINLYRDPMDRLDTFMQAEGEYPEPAKKTDSEKKN